MNLNNYAFPAKAGINIKLRPNKKPTKENVANAAA
jgi:hypothetical protein